MRILLTGGSGFVGQHLITRLRDEGHSVLALARSDRAARTVERLGAVAVRGDLADLREDPDRTARWLGSLGDVDAVVHAAARMEFWGADAGFVRDNHEPAVALHRAAADAGVRRFVLISAAGISSGSQRAAVVDETTDDGTPNTAYNRVKRATEQALREATPADMTLIILRPPFVWGAGMTTLDDVAARAAGGRFAWIDGGRHTMDFVHVDNLAHAVGWALEAGRSGAVYYVTDGTPMPIRDYFAALLATRGVDVRQARSVPLRVAEPLARVLDRGARLLRRPTPPPLTNWLITIMGRDRSYDITRARTELRYTPQTGLQEGLDAMAAVASPTRDPG